MFRKAGEKENFPPAEVELKWRVFRCPQCAFVTSRV